MNFIKLPFLLVYIFILFVQLSIAQNVENNLTLTVTGQGKTIDKARTSALRSAIEQAFGAFISSNTTILNDNLIKDEIVSISNGNISKYDILSEVILPDGSFATSITAIVSIGKLTSFCNSKGIKVEFKGALFAMNIKMNNLNALNEINALKNSTSILKQLLLKSFDYNLKTQNPKKAADGNWAIPTEISVSVNDNFSSVFAMLYSTLKSLSLSKSEYLDYHKQQINVYPIAICISEKKSGYFILRSMESVKILTDFIQFINPSILNFIIDNGLDKFSLNDIYSKRLKLDKGIPKNNIQIIDDNFRFYLRDNGGGYMGSIFIGEKDYNDPSDFPLILEQLKNYSPLLTTDYFRVNSNFITRAGAFQEFNRKSSPINFLFRLSETNNGLNEFLGADLVLSFKNVSNGSPAVKFNFSDTRTLEEINKISEYKIVVNEN